MTDPSTTPSVRKLRHSIRKRAYIAYRMTAGVPGATKEQQIQVFDQQIKLLEEALEKAKQARDIVFLRDFDAHQEEKKVQQTAHDAVKLPEAEQSKFEELIAQLSGQFDAEHGGFKADDDAAEAGTDGEQPPF